MPKGQSYIQPAQSTDQQTPRDLFDALWEEHGGFDLDPCCTPDQYTAKRVLENGGSIYIPPDHPLAEDEYKQSIHRDGLAIAWHGRVYMNPPWGLALRKWVPKAVHEVECGNAELVVALVPAKTDTQWFQEYVMRMAYMTRYDNGRRRATYIGGTKAKASEIRFIKGRLTFEGFSAPAGHASAIVVWRR